jgi:hypothetical protein
MTRILAGRSRWLLAAGGVVLAAAVGCQSAPDPAPAAPATAPGVVPAAPPPVDHTATTPDSTTGGTDRTSPPPPGTPRCHTADLALKVGQDDSATGHTGLNLALVNRSTHRCRIYGYGGVQLLDATGAALPTRQERTGQRPELVTLRPGHRAYSALTWISSPEAPPCSNAAFLQVIPPDETEPIRARFAHSVCGNGVLNQGPYQPNPT